MKNPDNKFIYPHINLKNINSEAKISIKLMYKIQILYVNILYIKIYSKSLYDKTFKCMFKRK